MSTQRQKIRALNSNNPNYMELRALCVWSPVYINVMRGRPGLRKEQHTHSTPSDLYNTLHALRLPRSHFRSGNSHQQLRAQWTGSDVQNEQNLYNILPCMFDTLYTL